jgi:hypothetical protein
MSRRRIITVFALVALFGAVGTAHAQTARGTVKVQPRFFNPFRPAAGGNLTISPFGVISFAPASPAAVAAATTAAVASSTAQSASVDSPGVSAGGSMRLPYRPDPRSGYRPPPGGPIGP